MRPTINDIAREAAVSLATVDRVLNERPGVRKVTITRVNAAVEKLGYVRDVTAANLAKRRRYRFVFVLPEDTGEFHSVLRNAINEATIRAVNERTEVRLIPAPAHDPHSLVRTIEHLDCDEIDGVAIMAPETPQLRDAIKRLKDGGVAIVALVSDLPNTHRDHFVGINNIAAGRTAGVLMGRFLGKDKVRILVLTSSVQSHDSAERRLGFDQIIADQFPNLEVLPTIEGHDDPQTVKQGIITALNTFKNIAGVYSMGSGNRTVTRLLQARNLSSDFIVIAHELTPHTRIALEDGTIDVVITQNIGHIVRSTLRVLRAKSDQMSIDSSQERIRIDVVLRENLQ